MKMIRIIGVIIALFIAIGFSAARAQEVKPAPNTLADAQVVSIVDTGKVNQQNKQKITTVTFKVLSGKYSGKTYTVEENTIALPYRIHYNQGDQVIVTITQNPDKTQTVMVTDYNRRPQLLVLLVLFLVVSVAVGRRQGITSLIGMVISLYAIAQIVIPSILEGTNAFTITMIASLIIIPATYYPAHGFNKKATIAVASTFITLIIVVTLAYIFTAWTKLSGFESEEASFLQASYGSINILSLLLAGMVIGALAVLDDITISQASIVSSLRKSNNKLSNKELYKHAMDVGKDHVASLVNTLILVYIGAAFPLVLLFYNTPTPISLVLNQEIIATEIVRTLVSSIGIILAVPITTYIAVRFGD